MTEVFIEISLILLLFILTILLKEKVVNYSVMKYLNSEEKMFLNECGQIIHRAQRIIYWPTRTDEKPNHIHAIEDNKRNIEHLQGVAVRRLIQKLIFSQ
jgi:hypothetical protein